MNPPRIASELDFTAAMDSACLHVEVEIVFRADVRVPVLGPVAYPAALAPLSEAGLTHPQPTPESRATYVTCGLVRVGGHVARGRHEAPGSGWRFV